MKSNHAIVVFDQDKGIYTAFIKEYPGVVIQTRDKEKISAKLEAAWKSFVQMLSERNFQYESASMH